MKERLITNGVLSIVHSIFIIFWIVAVINDLTYYAIFTRVINILISIASIVMGICTLSMKKDAFVRGLTIASGVLAILSGITFVAGAIVSFIAVSKIAKNNQKEEKQE